MPSLMRIFTQSDDYVRFVPHGPEDVAVQNKLVTTATGLSTTTTVALKSCTTGSRTHLSLKLVSLSTSWDETVDVKTEEYEGLNDEELMALLADEEVEVVEQEKFIEGEDMLCQTAHYSCPSFYNVKVKAHRKQWACCH
jgi:hypothetical protein